MALSHQEAVQIKTDVEVIKASNASVLKALEDNANAQKENTILINDLLITMKERDVRWEYEKKERAEEEARNIKAQEELKGYIKRVDDTIVEHIKSSKDVIDDAKSRKQTRKKFFDAMVSGWGKTAGTIILAAAIWAITNLNTSNSIFKIGS